MPTPRNHIKKYVIQHKFIHSIEKKESPKDSLIGLNCVLLQSVNSNILCMDTSTELILIRITGLDRPGLTASITEILSKYDVTILDIGQADIHSTLSLGILFKSREKDSGNIMKDLLFNASSLGITIRFYPITVEEYEEW